MRSLRVGAVNYLNTKPLVEGLDREPGVALAFDLPSRLATGLADGRYDVALIPSVEFFQDPSYSVVSNACIACRGPVLSVKLFFRRPPAEVKTLALDEGSRTSAALAKILLAERFGLSPRLEPLPIGSSLADTSADAVLLIGDRAIHSPGGRFTEVWDLGDVWTRHTGLPFVFAMWVARAGVDTGEVETALLAARDRGLGCLPAIAEREAPAQGLTAPQCLSYLRDNLHFSLGPAELRGLTHFYHRARDLGLAPPGVDLEFDPCQLAR
jgi:chorismate dehydratase